MEEMMVEKSKIWRLGKVKDVKFYYTERKDEKVVLGALDRYLRWY